MRMASRAVRYTQHLSVDLLAPIVVLLAAAVLWACGVRGTWLALLIGLAASVVACSIAGRRRTATRANFWPSVPGEGTDRQENAISSAAG